MMQLKGTTGCPFVLFAMVLLCTSCSVPEKTSKKLITKRLYQNGYHIQGFGGNETLLPASTVETNDSEEGMKSTDGETVRAQLDKANKEKIAAKTEPGIGSTPMMAGVIDELTGNDLTPEFVRREIKKTQELIHEPYEEYPPEDAPYMTLAIIGFVLSLLFFPVGLFVCIIALDRFNAEPGKWRGRGFAKAGLLISLLSILFIIYIYYLVSTWY